MTVQTTTPDTKIADLGKTKKGRSLMSESMQRLFRNKAAIVGMFIIAMFTSMAVFAPFIAPHDPLKMNSGKDFLPPAWVEKAKNGKSGDPEFLLGTDTLGRDVLSRVLYGARVSMIVGLVPATIILVVGTFIGMMAGFAGGSTDNLLMRFTDVIYAFPDLLFFIIVMIALRDSSVGKMLNGLFLLFIALAIVNWVGVARLVRGNTLSLKQKEFIEAARSIGVKSPRIMRKHLLPNTLGVLIVSGGFPDPQPDHHRGHPGLSRSWVCGQPPTPSSFFVTSWGSLLLEGQTAINAQPWMLLAPAICIALVVMAFTFLGDGLRDALDPRMRGTQ